MILPFPRGPEPQGAELSLAGQIGARVGWTGKGRGRSQEEDAGSRSLAQIRLGALPGFPSFWILELSPGRVGCGVWPVCRCGGYSTRRQAPRYWPAFPHGDGARFTHREGVTGHGRCKALFRLLGLYRLIGGVGLTPEKKIILFGLIFKHLLVKTGLREVSAAAAHKPEGDLMRFRDAGWSRERERVRPVTGCF